MDDEDFYIDHHGARMLFEAMMYAGGFRLQRSRERGYSSSPDLSPIRKRSVSPSSGLRKGEREVLPSDRFRGKNYNEIAEKNAQELIKEEERAKIKAEKKKAKKERQKQKRLIDSAVNNNSNNDNIANKISQDMENLALSPDNKEAEGLDVHAAFVSKAIKKVKHSTIISEDVKSKKEVKDFNSILKLALEYENKEHFKEAVQYVSEAISLAPDRVDLILKRSFLYYELAKFEKSVRDAKKVIQYSPNNADGYFRLGEANFALNNLSEAEEAFSKLLCLGSYVDFSNKRLYSIRLKQLEEMGYHPNEAFTALKYSENKTLGEAIEYLNALENGKTSEDLYYSDEEEESEEEESAEEKIELPTTYSGFAAKPVVNIDKNSRLLTDPSNPFQCCSLFVGNLKADITYQEVHNVFIKFGEIKTIRLMTKPNCYAFVNYEAADAAGEAMEALQGSRWLLSTAPLIIKYPVNIIKNTIPTMKNPEFIESESCATTRPAPVADSKASVGKPPVLAKPRPAPQTTECYYWRTTGCVYGNKCFNLHIPESKGIALNVKKPFSFHS